MELKLAILLTALCLFAALHTSDAGTKRRRKIIIHIPVKVKAQKHTHTLVKSVHHHHQPTVIKEEKIIKQEIHKVPVKEEVEHEHFHHHYKHDHATYEHDAGHELHGGGGGNSYDSYPRH